MNRTPTTVRRWLLALCGIAFLASGTVAPAQQWVTETRDPRQTQDEDFAKAYAEWTGNPRFGSPLVDHLPKVAGIPSPKDVLGHHIGAPRTLTYYADILKYYRALAAATPRVRVESIGKTDEGREAVVVWVTSDANMRTLQTNRDNLAKLADPRGLADSAIRQLIQTTKPHYHLMGGLHSGEFGPPEMLMELVYRLAVETSPYISQIRDNVYVSVTPVADPDGRDRNLDLFYCNQAASAPAAPGATAGATASQGRGAAAPPSGGATAPGAAAQGGGRGGAGGGCALPYWGKYVYHDNNRDINLSQVSMRAITDWYYTAHPPIMHDLHESLAWLYTYSGGPPQNPNLDPLLFAELPFFANWELSQMTKWGMPGVYTHAFMDGWSPGYLGSVAYNHNGLMKMYETQSGSDGGGRGGARGGGAPAAGAAPAAQGRGAAGAAAGRGGDAGAGGQRAGGAGAGRGQAAPGRGAAPPAQGRGGAGGGRAGAVPTGRGGGQNREWYRGIPVPQGETFTRRNNTNYMQTGVLSALQLTAMFPNLVLENFYTKTRNSIEQGRTQAPFGYVIPKQRDMTKPAELVRVLLRQGIEVGQTAGDVTIGGTSYDAGTYVIKGGQPYWRLAKNLLERQDYPDPALRTYDDSGWTMGYAFNVEVTQIDDRGVLDVAAPLVKTVALKGEQLDWVGTCDGVVRTVVLHNGSNNMITFRYRLKNQPMQITEKSFTTNGHEVPAGSFVIEPSGGVRTAAIPAMGQEFPDVNRAVSELGLTSARICGIPTVPMHDADVPRVAIYSQWSGTQELGWWRHAFDQFGIPYDLIYKERVARGNLQADYDVIIMAAQSISRTQVLAPPAARPLPYLKSDTYKFMGMYGESPDTTGGFGTKGVEAFQQFFEAGGTLIAAERSVNFPIEFGFARTIDTEGVTGVNAQKPLVQAEIVRTDHPVFYGYASTIFPIKYAAAQTFFRVGSADQNKVLARFVGGDAAVLSGLMVGGDAIAGRAFAVDVPGAHNGKGRVVMFAGNPVYRWQNHGEFNMVFNAIINWNDGQVK